MVNIASIKNKLEMRGEVESIIRKENNITFVVAPAWGRDENFPYGETTEFSEEGFTIKVRYKKRQSEW